MERERKRTNIIFMAEDLDNIRFIRERSPHLRSDAAVVRYALAFVVGWNTGIEQYISSQEENSTHE